VARANRINGAAPPSRETATAAEPVDLAAATGDVFPNGAAVVTDPEKASVEPLSSPRPDTIVRTGNDVVDFLEASRIEPVSPASVRRATCLAVSFDVVFLGSQSCGAVHALWDGGDHFARGLYGLVRGQLYVGMV
jgi:hypothetical protein